MPIYGKSIESSLCFHTAKQTLKRGFIVNSELFVENMKKISLVNKRIACDHLSVQKSKLHNLQIDKKPFFSRKSARIKYDHYLEQEKEAQDVSEKAEKRKIIHEIALVKKNTEDLTECTASLDSNITKYSIDAEANREFYIASHSKFFSKNENGI